MKKMKMMQMEVVQGGRCKWWKVGIGALIFLSSPVTGLLGAGVGATIFVSACDGW